MKCRTCKHWKDPKFNLGKCEGIFASAMIIPIHISYDNPGAPLLPQDQKKKGKLITKQGIISSKANNVLTPSTFYCSNWTRK